MTNNMKKILWMNMLKAYPKITLLFIICSLLFSVSACSEEVVEEEEYANWQQRNEAYFASLQDSLSSNPAQWKRIKKYSLDPATEGLPTDYVYAKIIETAPETETASPCYTDTVRMVYQGRLIPTATYPQGFVFDGTVSGQFSVATGYTLGRHVYSYIPGMASALQHMRRGDHWRLYIPHELGYGASETKNNAGATIIPAYSTLIFEVQLVDFCADGETLPAWSSRQRR